ncbi:MAG: arylsulfatase [Bacteroidota bacterium]
MYRKQNIALSLLLTFILLSLILGCQENRPENADERPNIILIMADDMGFSDLGIYGSEIPTPFLDSLGENGIIFSRFYNAARCCPTRASLLTGLYPHRAGIGKMVSSIDASPELGPYQGFLTDSSATLAEVLGGSGYNCYMSGKWHVGEKPEYWPMKRGFDDYFGLISGASSYYELITNQPRVREMVMGDASWTPPDSGFYMTDAFTDHAVRFVEDAPEDQPFFLYLAYTAPHWPMHAPEEEIVKYRERFSVGWDEIRNARAERLQSSPLFPDGFVLSPKTDGLPAWEDVPAAEQQQWIDLMATYAAMVNIMDRGIGKVMNSLSAKGVDENTLVIFLSDNGACAENIAGRKLHDPNVAIGARGSYIAYDEPWANVSSTPFRYYKKNTYEGGSATSFIAHWPRRIRAGQLSHQVGHVIDIMPTLADLAGATYPSDLAIKRPDGISLKDYLMGASETHSRRIAWEHFGNRAILDGKWKLVAHKDADWELYDMDKDRTELNDLSTVESEVKDRLEDLYGKWVRDGYRFE